MKKCDTLLREAGVGKSRATKIRAARKKIPKKHIATKLEGGGGKGLRGQAKKLRLPL